MMRYITPKAELIHHISHEAKRFKSIRKPDKLYLANTNLFPALSVNSEIGTIRETYFVSMLSSAYTVHYIEKGDFLIDERFVFEVGGDKKIPLWLFGFLY
ncbi:MAG: hypothetical protein QM493_01395 [Sulfurovum sp.]